MNTTSFFVLMTSHFVTHAFVAISMCTNTGYLNFHVILNSCKVYLYKIKTLMGILTYDTLLVMKLS